MQKDIKPGQSFPLGATVCPDGTNFSLYSKNGKSVELLFFDQVDDARPSRVLKLDTPSAHRTFDYWHVFVPGIKAGHLYGYRVGGPFDGQQGLRYDASKLLLYHQSIVPRRSYVANGRRGAANQER